jgi:hypothetical protein
MSQKEIQDFLIAHPGWQRRATIAASLRLSPETVAKNLRDAEKWGDIEVQRSREGYAYEYRAILSPGSA